MKYYKSIKGDLLERNKSNKKRIEFEEAILRFCVGYTPNKYFGVAIGHAIIDNTDKLRKIFKIL